MVCVWSINDVFSGFDDAPCRDGWAMDLMFWRRDFLYGRDFYIGGILCRRQISKEAGICYEAVIYCETGI